MPDDRDPAPLSLVLDLGRDRDRDGRREVSATLLVLGRPFAGPFTTEAPDMMLRAAVVAVLRFLGFPSSVVEQADRLAGVRR